jgi:hypothetical protein
LTSIPIGGEEVKGAAGAATMGVCVVKTTN